MAFILKTDNSIIPVEINQEEDSLLQMQGMVGGYIELVPLHDGSCLMVNEEGKMLNLPENKNATFLFRVGRNCHDIITGDVVHVLRSEILDTEGAFDEDNESEATEIDTKEEDPNE